MTETAEAPEPLHEDLVPYLQDSRVGGKILHHPLVVMPAFAGFERHVNSLYARKSRAVRDAIFDGNYRRYIRLHERAYRFDALREVLEQEGAWDYECDEDETEVETPGIWGLVSYVWCDSENIHQSISGWKEVWQSEFPNRHLAMDNEERAKLLALPDEIEVYRGYSHPDALHGMSWTTTRDRAEWFARRFASEDERAPKVAIGRVRKSGVFAFFDRRDEDEIVVVPEAVDVVSHGVIARKKKSG